MVLGKQQLNPTKRVRDLINSLVPKGFYNSNGYWLHKLWVKTVWNLDSLGIWAPEANGDHVVISKSLNHVRVPIHQKPLENLHRICHGFIWFPMSFVDLWMHTNVYFYCLFINAISTVIKVIISHSMHLILTCLTHVATSHLQIFTSVLQQSHVCELLLSKSISPMCP